MKYDNITKKERKKLLSLSFKDRLEITRDIIKESLEEAKYPIIQFSGGIDSCIMAYLIHEIDETVPCLFMDWGLFLPNQIEFCKKFFKKYNFKYYISNSGYNYEEFLKEYGFPIFKGITKKIKKEEYENYNITTKCRMLKNRAWTDFRKKHKGDYYFVGILADESPQRKNIFLNHGFYTKKNNGIRVKPISLLKKDEIFKYCKNNNILYPKDFYKDVYDGKEFHYDHCDLGCFMCANRFNKFGYGRLGRNARNHKKHIIKVLDLGLRDTLRKIVIDYPEESKYISEFLSKYDKKPEKRTAYDLDGVLMPYLSRSKSYKEQSPSERKIYEEIKKYHFKISKVFVYPLEPEFYIITSRRKRYENLTKTWLEKKNIRPKELVMMEGSLTFNKIVSYKLNKLKEYKIERYYEDDLKIVKYLKKRLPDVDIIHVQRRKSSCLTEKHDLFTPVSQGLMNFL